MSNPRYSDEFKEEAVRQVLERGYSVSDVSKRIGVSAHSLYKWVRSSRPNKSKDEKNELLDVKRENLKLRAELRRVQEERDILKKAALSSSGQGIWNQLLFTPKMALEFLMNCLSVPCLLRAPSALASSSWLTITS